MVLAPSIVEPSKESKNLPNQGREIGNLGESFALTYLKDKKYIFIEKNWTCKIGELDLIFRDKNTLVFVEVKTRVDSPFAAKHIFDNITWKKQKKLRQLAQIYLFKNFRDNARPYYRIDVVGVILSRENWDLVKVNHITSAISDVSF